MNPNEGKPLELVITRDIWESTVRHLLLNRDSWAVGSLRWNESQALRYALVDNLTVDTGTPTGQARPPLADWVAVQIPSGDQERQLIDVFPSLNPGASQRLVVLSLGRNGSWSAALWRRGQIEPIRSLEIVGGGMLRLEEMASPEEPTQAILRWSRTIGALGHDVWRKVRRARVTIIGAGRNASMLAFQLAALGVAQLRLIDPAQSLDVWNLDAMLGLTATDVGTPKVTALARRLLEFRPDLAVSALALSVTDPQVAEAIRDRPDLLAPNGMRRVLRSLWDVTV